MYILETIASAVNPESISSGQCFTCGGVPSTGRGEHVIPMWLQHQYSLKDERLSLLNRTLIPYRQLTIPCCTNCNNEFLSSIELQVQSIFERGKILNQQETLAVAQWMAKLFIGILVKETALLFDRADPQLGKIVPAEFIEELHHCQLILQSSRKTVTFNCLHNHFPFSLYWFHIERESSDSQFDLSTNVVGQSIAIRAGELGVVFINDGGLQMEAGPKGPFALSGTSISPIQFGELAARIHYKSKLRDATHFYLNSETETHIVINQRNVRPYSNTILKGGEIQIFETWNNQEFAHVASAITGLNQSVFYDETNGKEMTLLGNIIDKI